MKPLPYGEFPRLGPCVFLPGPNRSPYPNCNGLYVEAADPVLIDQGGSVAQALQLRRERGISRIYVTHWHEDHALSACAMPDVALHVPVKDIEPILSREATHLRGGVTDPDLQREIDALYDGMGFRHRPVTGAVEPEAEIDLGGVRMIALHTPGHTSGHTCYWFPEHGVVVLGDYDLTRAGPVCPDADSSVRDTYASLRRLAELPVRRAASAHGRGWFTGEEFRERLQGYVAVQDGRLARIRDLVASGCADLDALRPHFRALFQMPELPGYEAWGNVSGGMLIRPCLQYLTEEGKLREVEPGRYEAV